MAVSGIVFLFIIASSSHLHAAQCGGLPKGWLPSHLSVKLDRITFPIGGVSVPAVPPRAPCKCTGTSCSPAAPTPAPDHRVSGENCHDADLEPTRNFPPLTNQSEFPDATDVGLRYEVVLSILRPPCGV